MNNSLRILLFDDNRDDHALLIRELRREFPDLPVKQITEAKGFAQALEAGNFDLVITDYQLGWTDGLAVLRAVKARSPDYPVIMLTGTDSEEIAAEAMKARLDVYVTKSPQHFAFLPAVVRSIQEQLQKRQVMKQAETLYRNLYERVPVGLYRTTPTGEILDANPALME
ncbi:MAG: response regulator, partial [Chloroflexi bacterium]|nr:response regulator [Chloroflexota bacterium]